MSVFFLLPSRQSAVGDLNQRHYNLKSNGGTGDARPGLVPILSCQIFSVSPADAYKRPRLFPPSPYITQHHMSTSPDLGFSGVTTRRSERADPFQICIGGQQARGGNCITCKNLFDAGHTVDALASYAVAASSFLPPFARASKIKEQNKQE